MKIKAFSERIIFQAVSRLNIPRVLPQMLIICSKIVIAVGGFEPARAEPNRFLVYRLNHSATTASTILIYTLYQTKYTIHIHNKLDSTGSFKWLQINHIIPWSPPPPSFTKYLGWVTWVCLELYLFGNIQQIMHNLFDTIHQIMQDYIQI